MGFVDFGRAFVKSYKEAYKEAKVVDLTVPYVVADMPRVFLHVLNNTTEENVVPKVLHDLIDEFLTEYDAATERWIGEHYGPTGVSAAIDLDHYSVQAVKHFISNAKAFKPEPQSDASPLEEYFNQ